mmetsp:Transcript_13902/g.30417  ORF Transcript_13902/g.30417 Transcript_13902/m.30417 type:complete len:238 (+) Transcript_13902:204-917(+)
MKKSRQVTWTEKEIDEFVRLRREKAGNQNSWVKLAGLLGSRDKLPQDFANLWHGGNASSQLKRFSTPAGKHIPLKHCVDPDGHWKPEFEKKKKATKSMAKLQQVKSGSKRKVGSAKAKEKSKSKSARSSSKSKGKSKSSTIHVPQASPVRWSSRSKTRLISKNQPVSMSKNAYKAIHEGLEKKVIRQLGPTVQFLSFATVEEREPDDTGTFPPRKKARHEEEGEPASWRSLLGCSIS